MSEIVSTLTLRLTQAEATQLEILKKLVHKNTGSEAIKYIIREYPRFCTHYKLQAEEWKNKESEHRQLERKLDDINNAMGVLFRAFNDSK